jgi:hypothetical protein
LPKPHVRLIRYEPGRPEVRGNFAERRKPHFDRAVKLTDASGCHNRLSTDRYHIPPQYGIGLSGSAGGIEPADVLLSLPQSRSPLASYTASHLCALCRRPADHFYPWSSLRPHRIG